MAARRGQGQSGSGNAKPTETRDQSGRWRVTQGPKNNTPEQRQTPKRYTTCAFQIAQDEYSVGVQTTRQVTT